MGILATLIGGYSRRTSIESPSFDLNSAAAWDALTNGQESASGVKVSTDSALTYSPWWRGINLISGDVGRISLYAYKRNGEGKDRAAEHPAYYLLRRKPNPYQTAMAFRQQLTGHALSEGNGYAYIDRAGDGMPTALWPLDPCRTYPEFEGRKLWYVLEDDTGPKVKVDPSNILHVKGLTWDGVCGYSVVEKARDSLGLGMATARHSAKFYANGAKPGVVLETDAMLQEKQVADLRTAWERMHTGLDNLYRTAILDRGLKAHTLSFSAEDAQLIETRQFEIREVANWLGLPPHKLGDTTRTAYASLEQENQKYLDEGLDYWLRNWEEECWDKLLTEAEKRGDTHIIEFNRKEFVRGDLKERTAAYRAGLAGRGWLTQNEVRAAENLNPIDDPAADAILEPLNMGQGGDDNQPNDPNGDTPGGDQTQDRSIEAVNAVLQDAHERAITRIGNQAERATKQPKFMDWIDSIQDDQALRAILTKAFDVAAMFRDSRPSSMCVSDYLEQQQKELRDIAGQATAKQLPGALEAWAKKRGAESWNGDSLT